MEQIVCKDLSPGYDGKKVAEGLTFTVNAGDYLCIVGENGAGKSTLMKTLLRLIPPVSGSIDIAPDMRRGAIGYLPQVTAVQKDFPASVAEIVRSGCLNQMGMRPFYSKSEKALALKSMERMGIENLAKSVFRELSGGQQQRVLLARALCAGQKLLLLDEPVASLDPQASLEMYRLVESLNTKDKITIIMISHDISAAVKYAGHILHIGQHRAMFYGTKDEYLASDIGKIYSSGGNVQ